MQAFDRIGFVQVVEAPYDNALHLYVRLPSQFLHSQQPSPTLGIKLAWTLGSLGENNGKSSNLV